MNSSFSKFIFSVLQTLGTPTEETWEGVTRLPGYNDDIYYYPPKKLGLTFTRLYDIVDGENIASSLLQVIIYLFYFIYSVLIGATLDINRHCSGKSQVFIICGYICIKGKLTV